MCLLLYSSPHQLSHFSFCIVLVVADLSLSPPSSLCPSSHTHTHYPTIHSCSLALWSCSIVLLSYLLSCHCPSIYCPSNRHPTIVLALVFVDSCPTILFTMFPTPLLLTDLILLLVVLVVIVPTLLFSILLNLFLFSPRRLLFGVSVRSSKRDWQIIPVTSP
jgi:hypothetical protein